MNTITISLLVAACIFAGGVGGLFLHRIVPRDHLTRETLDVIKLGTGMLSVLASLVLGLLIATAKTSHDQTDQAIRNYAAQLALLNETLRDYGGAASVPRDRLRDAAPVREGPLSKGLSRSRDVLLQEGHAVGATRHL